MLTLPRPFALLVLLLAATPAWALPPGFAVETVYSNLNFPTALRFTPDGRLFYGELFTGRIIVAAVVGGPRRVWATLDVEINGEHGLLGMVIHPAWPDSPYVYTFHTNAQPFENR